MRVKYCVLMVYWIFILKVGSFCLKQLGAPLKPWERKPPGSTSGRSSTPLGPSSVGQKPWENPPPSPSTTITPTTSTSASLNPSQQIEGQAAREQPGNALAPSPLYSSPYQSSYNPYGGVYGSRSNALGMGGVGYGSGYNSYGAGYGTGYSTYGSGNGYGSYSGYGGYQRSNPYGYRSPYMQSYGGLGGGYSSPYGGVGGVNGLPGPPVAGQGHLPGWQSFLNGLQRVVNCLGRMSFLVDENAQALHFFVNSLLQMLDRAGSLYGEVARFVLRILGYKPRKDIADPKSQPSEVHQALVNTPNGVLPGYSNGRSLASAWQDIKD